MQTIRRPDEGVFAKNLGDGKGQRIENGAIDGRLLHCNLLKPETGTVTDKARLNGASFKIHGPIGQRLELFTLLRRNADDISCLDTNHTTFGTVGGRREIIENGVDLVSLADPNAREIGEQNGLWGRFLWPQRRKPFVLNSRLGLGFKVGSFGSLQRGGGFGQDVGMGKLRNSIDENLLGRCTEGEWVTVPKDNV